MRMIDILLAFPYILMVLVVVAILGPSLWTGMAAVGIAGIPGYARLVRSTVLTVKREDYVVSARALGASETEILFFTVLPNVLSPLIVYLSFATPLAALLRRRCPSQDLERSRLHPNGVSCSSIRAPIFSRPGGPSRRRAWLSSFRFLG